MDHALCLADTAQATEGYTDAAKDLFDKKWQGRIPDHMNTSRDFDQTTKGAF